MKSLPVSSIKIWVPALISFLGGAIAGFCITFFTGSFLNSWLIIVLSTFITSSVSSVITFILYNKTLGEIAYLIKQAAIGRKIGGPQKDEIRTALQQELDLVVQILTKLQQELETSSNWLQSEINHMKILNSDDIQLLKAKESQLGALHNYMIRSIEELAKILTINRTLVNSAVRMRQSTQEMAKDTSQTSKTVNDGIKSVGHEIRAISDLKSTMGSSTKVIQDLNEMSRSVSQFITIIGSISRRTELLALNAAIEAARAGETGRGFSVVANEIRTLSESSKKATEEIADLIHEIEIRTNNAINAMRNTNKLEENIKVVYAAGDTFIHIVKEVKSIDEIVNRISELTLESSEDAQLMNKLLEKLEAMLYEGVGILEALKQEVSEQSRIGDKLTTCYQHLQRRLLQQKNTKNSFVQNK